MTFQHPNPQPFGPDAPRPSASQVTGARMQLYAQNHPAGFAVRGAALAAAGTAFLAVIAAAPSLVDPTNVPGWTLVAILAAMVIGALLVGLPMYLHGRNLPLVEETDPVRYASARLQAATGELGAHGETNRLARQLCDRLVHTSNPAYNLGGLFVLLGFVALLPLADVVGPGFEARNLLQLSTGMVFLIAAVLVYSSVKAKHDRYKAFRAAYDRGASS